MLIMNPEISLIFMFSFLVIITGIPSRTICRRQFSALYATRIVPPLGDTDFFNRKSELSTLTSLLNGVPYITAVSGPINSGKTSLILSLLAKLSANNMRPVLYINLREKSFSTVSSFQSSLEDDMGSWLTKCKEVAKNLKLTFEPNDLKIGVSLKDKPTFQLSSLDSLGTLFSKFSDSLPSYDWWNGTQSPILFIDEANKLKMLLDDPDGHNALLNLFDWFVSNTKENHRFHVILGSSDSFFHLWVSQFIGQTRFKTFVVGDLSKEEALRFWQDKIITQIHLLNVLPPPSFSDAYQICGGNMFLLRQYFDEYCLSEGDLQPTNFYLFAAELRSLYNAYFSNVDSPSTTESSFGIEPPAWNREQLILLMQSLTKSEHGFLIYTELCGMLGGKVVDSFIAHNIIHLRPAGSKHYDIPDAPYDEDIVTAETRSSLVAMNRLLTNIKRN